MTDTVAKLTLREKIDLLVGEDAWHSGGVPRLGIKSLRFADGPNGVRCEAPQAPASDKHNRHGSLPATCFPTPALLAAGFDEACVKKTAVQLGREAAYYGVDVLLGPGINHKRTPIGGRNFEYFSEDPVLTGRLAAAFVSGVQACSVGCSLKHFFGNNTEYDRYEVDVEIGERALREIYLKTFEYVIAAARPATVMASYNRYRGQYVAESRLALTDLLRNSLSFTGTVISDWGAVRDRVAALRAGCDLEMGFDYRDSKARLAAAVQDGTLSETLLDTCCRRLLALRKICKADGAEIDFQKGYDVALEGALGGTVLLKNQGALPIVDNDFCVIGAAAVSPRFQGEGSSRVNAWKRSAPLEELSKLFGPVPYARGYVYNDPDNAALIDEARALAFRHAKAVLFIANDDYAEEESSDRRTLSLAPKHLALIDAISTVNSNTIVVLQTGGVTEMPYAAKVEAIVQQYFAGEASGEAAALLLTGKRNFSGRLPESFPVRYEDNPAFAYYAREKGKLVYGEDIFTGYRHYDRQGIPVRYPFGWGLSYTDFAYSDMRCRYADDTVECRVTVTNTGGVDGAEVVTLYVSKPSVEAEMPRRELIAFDKREIPAGESREFELVIRREQLWYWDERKHTKAVAAGEYRLAFYDRRDRCVCQQSFILR